MIDLNFSLDSGQDSEIGTIGGQGSTAAVERRLTRISLVRINTVGLGTMAQNARL